MRLRAAFHKMLLASSFRMRVMNTIRATIRVTIRDTIRVTKGYDEGLQ